MLRGDDGNADLSCYPRYPAVSCGARDRFVPSVKAEQFFFPSLPLFRYFSILCRFFCEREPSSQGGRLLVGLVGYPTRKVWKKHKRKRPSRSQLGGSLRSLPPPPPPSPSPPLPSPSSPPPLAAALAAALATTPRRWSRRSSSFASCWCVRRMSPWQCERQAVRFAVLAPVWLDWGGFFE